MRHKNADMIIAKANDMSLVLFSKAGNFWLATHNKFMPVGDEQYYLCHPKHKEICQAWLNGADVQWKGVTLNTWVNVEPEDDPDWTKPSVFMCDDQDTRIKPKKEKRWIAVDVKSSSVIRNTYGTKEELFDDEFSGCAGNASGWQFIEIEVEV